MWKVEITFRNLVDICNITEIYYSEKNTCQEAITDCINKFNREILTRFIISRYRRSRNFNSSFFNSEFRRNWINICLR